MISIKDGNIQVEGSLGELITEAARVVDAIASTIEEKSEGHGEDEITYDFIIEAILEYVAQMSKVNAKDNMWDTDEEIRFFQKVQEERKKFGKEDGFIDYDNGTQTPAKGKSSYGKTLKDTTSISGGMKLNGKEDFFIDPRITRDDLDGLVDINDLKKKKK